LLLFEDIQSREREGAIQGGFEVISVVYYSNLYYEIEPKKIVGKR